MTGNVRKSGAVSGISAAIGAFLALALGLQLGWGTWGLVATIFPCSCLGWILADWRGFVSSLSQAWKEVTETIPNLVKKIWRSMAKSAKLILAALKTYHKDSGYFWIAITSNTWMLLAFWGIYSLESQSSDPSFGAALFLVLICAFVLNLVGGVIPIIIGETLTEKLGKQRLGLEIEDKPEERSLYSWLKETRPDLCEEAKAKTRKWVAVIAILASPPLLPFLLAGLALYFSWKILPYVVWHIPKWLIWAGISLVSLTYLYANSDLRRVAFSSTALGMVAGFAIGYQTKWILLGTVVGGLMACLLGMLQHQFLYRPLARHRLATAD